MLNTTDGDYSQNNALPTFDETQAAIVLQAAPKLGDMRIRIDGPTMSQNASTEYVRHALATIGDAGAYSAVLVGRGDGSWAATDHLGLVRFAAGDGKLPEPTGWKMPALDEGHMVPVEEVEAERDEARKAASKQDPDSGRRYVELEIRANAERQAHDWLHVTPAYGDLLLVLDGQTLLNEGGEALIAPLYAMDVVQTSEVCLGHGRWTAFEAIWTLEVVENLRTSRSMTAD